MWTINHSEIMVPIPTVLQSNLLFIAIWNKNADNQDITSQRSLKQWKTRQALSLFNSLIYLVNTFLPVNLCQRNDKWKSSRKLTREG